MIAENIGKYILSYVTIDKSGYTKAVLKVMRLEKYNVSDEPMYAQLVFNQEIMKMNLGRVFTVEEARMAFQTVIMQNASEPQLGVYKVYIGENDEEYIGMGATCWNEEYSAVEIEYMLLPQYWNRGYGTALVKNLVHMAVTWKSGTNVIAITDPANICSQRILQKNGFVLIKQYLNQDGEAALLYQKSI